AARDRTRGAAAGRHAPLSAMMVPPVPLWEAWDELAPRLAHGTLLAAFDYDGTLVPIRPTPEEAIADESTRAALAALAGTAGTALAVVSGRPVAQLRDLVPADALWLVGLHGLEIAAPRGEVLPTVDLDAAAAALGPLRTEAEAIAARHPGVRIEDKGASLALHTRQAGRGEAMEAAEEYRVAAQHVAGFEAMGGKEVVEVRPAGTSKGTALRRLRREAGGETVLYVGDDTTDEDAFAVLEEESAAAGDGADTGVARRSGTLTITVRVGEPMEGARTHARFTIASQDEVARLLGRLLELRRR
ncbi:MAG TPA: trehalose-phosphatase, partial [Thermoanaerobaculia bacterium]|nr:trehalose-phosphatase [Thermoanaerobaculia bacterium]